jgi:hypothetical protein
LIRNFHIDKQEYPLYSYKVNLSSIGTEIYYAKIFRLYLSAKKEICPGLVDQGKAEESTSLPRKSRHPFSFLLVIRDQRVFVGAMVLGATRTSNPLSQSVKTGRGSILFAPST